ncbi:MAG: tRNA pseudouridine(38-40) synthase TruA [Aureispira sp.]|nr:tRNA pseudouridine(38-40) synthase TruA [Aureispira sp.]
MRYFLELAYNGTRFFGWQRQPNAISVQQRIEETLSILLRNPTTIMGCGRTDTGVHAAQYFAHFDTEQVLTDQFVHQMNGILKRDIVIYRVIRVEDAAHTRFDARSRSYRYYVDLKRNPFRQETAYFYPYARHLNIDLMQEAAQLLLEFKEFDTFCKTNTDAKTRTCDLRRSEWVYDEQEQQLVYHVTADRFLRGMIRLIVGMCLNVARGKYALDDVRAALEQQLSLKHALSAPAEGLFLCDIKYDYIDG